MADSTVLAGPNGNRLSLIIVLAVGVAVTSVPVVSKIFADLKILHTRFARLVLGVAVLEDIVLWLALAVATAVAGKAALNPRAMSYHLLATVAFFALGLTIVPRVVKRINKSRFNVMAQHSPVAYAIAVLLVYCVVAGALGVSLVFAAFLAGFAVVHKKRQTVRRSAGCHRQSLVRVLHSGVLRDCRTQARPGARPVAVDAGGLSGRKLPGEGALGVAGGTVRRLSRARSAESGDYHQCARRPGHRAGQRGLRGGNHQRHVLHHAGAGGCADVAGGRRMAGLRPAQRLAAADADRREEAVASAGTHARTRRRRQVSDLATPAIFRHNQEMFARKIRVQYEEGGQRIACPMKWLDSFSMRNFTNDQVLTTRFLLATVRWRSAYVCRLNDYARRWKTGSGERVIFRRTRHCWWKRSHDFLLWAVCIRARVYSCHKRAILNLGFSPLSTLRGG